MWAALAFLVVGMSLVIIGYVAIGIRGARSIKTDGWSPIEAVFGRKFPRKRNQRRDDE